MLTFQDLVSQYWKYYLALENIGVQGVQTR